MRLEDQVCSLELAKKLKELGVKQESYAYYIYSDGDLILSLDFIIGIDDQCSAFTVAELGQMLPDELQSTSASGSDKSIHYSKYEEAYYVGIGHENGQIIPVFYDENEADARAKILIYLIENKLI